MIKPVAIEEFKQIYLEEFGIELTEKDAEEKALRVLSAFKIFLTKSRPVLTLKERETQNETIRVSKNEEINRS